VRLSIAPMVTPTTRHAAASAAIHTRSFRSISRSASVVWPFGICNIKLYHLQIFTEAGNLTRATRLAKPPPGRGPCRHSLCAADEEKPAGTRASHEYTRSRHPPPSASPLRSDNDWGIPAGEAIIRNYSAYTVVRRFTPRMRPTDCDVTNLI
jgi:hypothetical protein